MSVFDNLVGAFSQWKDFFQQKSEELEYHWPKIKGHFLSGSKLCKDSITGFINTNRPGFNAWVDHHLREIKGAAGGGAIGIGAGLLMGGGGVGIVAAGAAFGLPLIAITGLVGAVTGVAAVDQLSYFKSQWTGAAERADFANRARTMLSVDKAEIDKNPEFLSDSDHYKFLNKAIDEAHKFVIIRSAFISDYVVDDSFKHLICAKLRCGVDFIVEYGYRFPWDSGRRDHSRENAERVLFDLCQYSKSIGPGHFKIVNSPTHIKELAIDDEFVVIGSNNWLSNRSFKNKEKSVILYSKKLAIEVRHQAEESWRLFGK